MENRKILGEKKFQSKLPARSGSKIPGPTPNKGILKPAQGLKREAEKENPSVAIVEPPPKKVVKTVRPVPSYMRPTASRSAARKSLARARRSVGLGKSPGKGIRRDRIGSSTSRAGSTRPTTSRAPSRTAAVSRPPSRTGATSRVGARKAPPAEPEPAAPVEDANPDEAGSRVRLTAEGKIIVKGVKKYDMKERQKVVEIVLAEKIIENRNLKRGLDALTTALESVKVEKKQADEETKELSDYKNLREQQFGNLEEKYSCLQRDNRRMKNDLESVQEHLDTTTKRLKSERLEKEELQADFDNSAKKISNLNLKVENLTDRTKELDNTIESLRIELAEKDKKLEDGDEERRILHETVQQLKGNIRVFTRVRPLLPKELAENHTAEHITFESNMDKGIEIAREDKKDKTEFEFDKVFNQKSTQAEVFEEVQHLVRSSLDGYNVCIFAYGQTGSGKTFSMEGPENAYDEEELVGIIPRSFQYLTETIEKAKEKGWNYTLEAAYLEVYCEELRDLLIMRDEGKKLKIEGAGQKHVNVANLTRHSVTSKQQILNLVKRANKRRATASTNVNERSSRSHSVFILFISGHNERTDMKVESCLNLVDLAGSERVKESGATGQRFEEAKKINGSLSSLGDVIAALGSKSKHIPYRNSKLTHLLQNSLGGNAKTLMITHLNPRKLFANESLNTLRFAQKVNNTNIGTAQKVVK